MILNSMERLILYKEMLVEANLISNEYYGFCTMITGLTDCCVSIEDLPELMEYQPNNEGGYWFEMGKWNPRINILREIIGEMEGNPNQIKLDL